MGFHSFGFCSFFLSFHASLWTDYFFFFFFCSLSSYRNIYLKVTLYKKKTQKWFRLKSPSCIVSYVLLLPIPSPHYEAISGNFQFINLHWGYRAQPGWDRMCSKLGRDVTPQWCLPWSTYASLFLSAHLLASLVVAGLESPDANDVLLFDPRRLIQAFRPSLL